MNHPLHITIGKIIDEKSLPGCKILRDRACGGKQNIPLFPSKRKSRETEYCDVDILILKSSKIRVIMEIEEADVKPTQICGKFLTSALSSYYIARDNNAVPMDNSVLFIQVLDTSKLKKDKTSKIKQWKNIEKSIRAIIPLRNSNIKEYILFYGDVSEFGVNGEKRKELVDCILEFLSL